MPKKKPELAVHVLLDRSGSMGINKIETIGSYNLYLERLATDTPDASFSLTIFDSGGIDTIVDNVPAKDVVPLNEETYDPRAATPLFDAVGAAVVKLDQAKAKAKVLVILTDGKENASKEYSKDAITKILAEKQAKQGWLVLFLGADMDAFGQAGDMGLAATHTLSASKSKLRETMTVAYASTARYAETSVTQSLDQALHNAGFTTRERKEASDD